MFDPEKRTSGPRAFLLYRIEADAMQGKQSHEEGDFRP